MNGVVTGQQKPWSPVAGLRITCSYIQQSDFVAVSSVLQF